MELKKGKQHNVAGNNIKYRKQKNHSMVLRKQHVSKQEKHCSQSMYFRYENERKK